MSMPDPLIQNYIEILEKTNEQLSFWYLPYEVGIGFLTVAIAVLTIGFSFLIWRQSSNNKKILNEFVEQKKKYLHAESQRLLTDMIIKFEELAKKSTEEERNTIEKRILELKKGINSTAVVKTNLSEAQIQAILGLLQSFGADNVTIYASENILEGKLEFIPPNTIARSNLTQAQIDAIIGLLQSFDAEKPIIDRMSEILRYEP